MNKLILLNTLKHKLALAMEKLLLVTGDLPCPSKKSDKQIGKEEFDFCIMNKTIASKGNRLKRVKEFNKSLLLSINFSSFNFNLSSLRIFILKQPLSAFVVVVLLF